MLPGLLGDSPPGRLLAAASPGARLPTSPGRGQLGLRSVVLLPGGPRDRLGGLSSLAVCEGAAGTPLPDRLAGQDRSPDAAGGTARTSLGDARASAAGAVAAACGPLGRRWSPPGRRLAAPSSLAAVGMQRRACSRERMGGALLVRQRAGSFCGGAAAPAVHDKLLVRAGCGGLGRVPRGRATAARCPVCRLTGCISAFSPRPGVSWQLSDHSGSLVDASVCLLGGRRPRGARASPAGMHLGALPPARCLLTAPCPRALPSMPPEGKQPRSCACKNFPGIEPESPSPESGAQTTTLEPRC